MIYLYLFGTCFHFIYVFMIIENISTKTLNGSHWVKFVKISHGLIYLKDIMCKMASFF